MPQCNTISNKVKVDLNVFNALMSNMIRGHVDNAHVVVEWHWVEGDVDPREVGIADRLQRPVSSN
jgi:hypothetical protein